MLFAEETAVKFVFPDRIDGWWEMLLDLGTKNPALMVLITLMLLDVITGVMASWISGSISSSASYKGMLRKGVMLAVVATARVMEAVIPNAPLMILGCIGFSCTELFSIVENAGRSGVPLPLGLKQAFEKFREDKKREEIKSPIIEVNVDGNSESKFKRPSDVQINVARDSGELDLKDNTTGSRIIIPKPVQGEKGDKGEKGDQGLKGDKGESQN